MFDFLGSEDGKTLLDLVRTAAVLATPITLYLAFRQLRASARATQGRTYFDTIAFGKSLTDTATELLIDEGASESEKKKFRIERLCITVLDYYENLYYQRKVGNFPDDRWDSWEKHIAKMFQFPDLIRKFEEQKKEQTLSPDFVAWVEKITSRMKSSDASEN